MGYRMYLGKLPKGEDPVVNVHCDIAEESYLSSSKHIENMYELGKYVEWRPWLSNNLLGEDNDCEIYIVQKDFLLYLIEEYRKRNLEYFSDLSTRFDKLNEKFEEENYDFSDDDKLLLSQVYCDLRRKGDSPFGEWGEELSAVNIEEKYPHEVCRSWLYEYGIFNLVHILKTFDWENDNLIYYGY